MSVKFCSITINKFQLEDHNSSYLYTLYTRASLLNALEKPTDEHRFLVSPITAWPSFRNQDPFRFWKSSGRWALVSLVLLLISCFFFLVLGLEEMPWTCAIALLFAVLVAGFIPFFWRSFSMSSISRGNSIPRNSCLRSSSTLMGTLGSFGYAISSWESKFERSQIWPAAFKA